MSRVRIDTTHLRRALRRMERDLKRPATIYGKAARHMRDYVRGTITKQGRKRKYTPLARFTRQKTGRRKALITLRPFIQSGWDNRQGVVFFNPPSKRWHIDQHHTGFTSKAVIGKMMVVRGRGGSKLAMFRSRGPVKVPAREVWPTQREVENEVTPIIGEWVQETARTRWR